MKLGVVVFLWNRNFVICSGLYYWALWLRLEKPAIWVYIYIYIYKPPQPKRVLMSLHTKLGKTPLKYALENLNFEISIFSRETKSFDDQYHQNEAVSTATSRTLCTGRTLGLARVFDFWKSVLPSLHCVHFRHAMSKAGDKLCFDFVSRVTWGRSCSKQSMENPRHYFTVDSELRAALLEVEEEYFGSNVGAEVTIESDESELESGNEDDIPSDEHELDVSSTAARYFEGANHSQPSPGNPEEMFVCGCKKECSAAISKAAVERNRLNFQEMEKSQRDDFVLGMLEVTKFQEVTARGTQRERRRFVYKFQGKEICLSMFRHIYNIGTKHFDNLRKHLIENGLVPRVHKGTGKRAHNATSFPVVQNAVAFLRSYAERFGTPHSAPLHGRSGAPPTFLPSSCTKVSIHHKFVESCQEADIQAVGIHSIHCIHGYLESVYATHHYCNTPDGWMWSLSTLAPQCYLRRFRRGEARRSVTYAVSEEEKLAAVEQLKTHIHAAQAERDFYKASILSSREQLPAHLRNPLAEPAGQRSNRPPNFMHYTFDFTQNVALPQLSRQDGAIYFKAPRKVQIFGVNCEAKPWQINYLIDEADTIVMDGKSSHGPNAVISCRQLFWPK